MKTALTYIYFFTVLMTQRWRGNEDWRCESNVSACSRFREQAETLHFYLPIYITGECKGEFSYHC